MKTKEAIKADYKELLSKINHQLEDLEKEAQERKIQLQESIHEQVDKLKKHKASLQSKYEQLESTAEESVSSIKESVESTYNHALEDLSSWLKEHKTRN